MFSGEMLMDSSILLKETSCSWDTRQEPSGRVAFQPRPHTDDVSFMELLDIIHNLGQPLLWDEICIASELIDTVEGAGNLLEVVSRLLIIESD